MPTNSAAENTLSTSDNRAHNETHVAATAGAVLRDYVAGIYNEAKEHPLKLLGEAAAGAAIAVGTSLLAPEIGAAAITIGAISAIGAVGKGVYDLADAARVIDNSSGANTKEQIDSAHLAIRHLGAESLDLAAVTVGGATANSWLGKFAATEVASYGVNGAPPAFHWMHDAAHVYTFGDFGSQMYQAVPSTGLFLGLENISSRVASEYKYLTSGK